MAWAVTHSRPLVSSLWSIWAGIESIHAMICPNPRQLLTLLAMHYIGGFDRCFYRIQISDLPWLYRLFPARHYAVFGEALGLQPTRNFCPKSYLILNPDVADAGIPPYWHWLTKGRSECRQVEAAPLIPTLPDRLAGPLRLRQRNHKSRFGAHVHIHYTEVWKEIEQSILSNGLKADFFITLTYQGPETERLRQVIQKIHPDADVIIVENRGRDILPFLTLLQSGAFEGYDAICKLHTKRSIHRVDGDRWRRRLVRGIFPRNWNALLEKFLSDPTAAIWAADGQRLENRKWWGANQPKVCDVLARIETRIGSSSLYFPSGSIYWVKPFTLGMLKSLNVGSSDFEPETGQLDGTMAHAIERVVGELARDAGQFVIETSELRARKQLTQTIRPKFVSAFYLPQFHWIEENDRWWGKGYTEWTAIDASSPIYNNHLTPKPCPSVGRYDLKDPMVMDMQGQLAKQSGIDAFCVYYYWFDGRRLLEEPIDRLLKKPSVEFPFYFCWANESWRRNWDGLSGETLMPQGYSPGFEKRLALDVISYLEDSRYQRPDGVRPRFVIYRPDDLPYPAANIARLREWWRKLGVGEVEIGAVRFHVGDDLPDDLVDFWIEMPPHGLFKSKDCLGADKIPAGLCKDFDGVLYEYGHLANRSASMDYAKQLPANTIRGIMPSWDNTARRGASAHIAFGATPAKFRKWLHALTENGLAKSYRNELFINAWNEWGEKAMLEPSETFGRLNLDAIREVTGKN